VSAREPTEREPARPAPDVLLDVEFDRGLLFLVVANAGERPALAVQVRFERPFRGLDGTVDVSALRLFRKIEFLPAGKEIRTLLDSSAAYFARREPARLAATISFRDERGGRHERRIVHDLAIYRDLAYVVER
jgi:hypothetical protein